MEKQIYIRVEGNKKVGLGHLVRCMALAEMLNSHFQITFVGKDVPEQLLQVKNKRLLKIQKEEEFLGILNEGFIVVVDGYEFDEAYYRLLKNKNSTVVSIQDIYRFSENIDLVINHLPGSKKDYRNVEVLSGPRHAIIRSAFLELPKKKDQNTNEAFISLGGTENYSLVNNIIKMLNLNEEGLRINVLTTDDNKERIRGENVVLFSNVDENQIVQLIDNSSICLITSGMISYEVLARNKRALIGALNDGQNTVGKQFEEMELVEYLGYWKDLTQETFSEAILMKNINQERVASIFDGRSGKRIRNKFLSL